MKNVALGPIWDPIAVKMCHAAGDGAALGRGLPEASNYMPLRIPVDLLFLWPFAAIACLLAISADRRHDRS